MASKKTIKKIFIMCNGTLSNESFHKHILKDADLIICADGGANNAKKINIVPDFIIGDLDSAKKEVLEYFAKTGKTEIILDEDQNKTDTELAITLAESFNPKEIIFLCATGVRLDHTIATMLCLDRISKTKNIKARIIDDKNEIVLIRNETLTIYGKKGDTVSVIPLTEAKGLTYNGLKWPLKNKSTEFNWFGVCNKMNSSTAKISVRSGKILVMKSRD